MQRITLLRLFTPSNGPGSWDSELHGFADLENMSSGCFSTSYVQQLPFVPSKALSSHSWKSTLCVHILSRKGAEVRDTDDGAREGLQPIPKPLSSFMSEWSVGPSIIRTSALRSWQL